MPRIPDFYGNWEDAIRNNDLLHLDADDLVISYDTDSNNVIEEVNEQMYLNILKAICWSFPSASSSSYTSIKSLISGLRLLPENRDLRPCFIVYNSSTGYSSMMINSSKGYFILGDHYGIRQPNFQIKLEFKAGSRSITDKELGLLVQAIPNMLIKGVGFLKVTKLARHEEVVITSSRPRGVLAKFEPSSQSKTAFRITIYRYPIIKYKLSERKKQQLTPSTTLYLTSLHLQPCPRCFKVNFIDDVQSHIRCTYCHKRLQLCYVCRRPKGKLITIEGVQICEECYQEGYLARCVKCDTRYITYRSLDELYHLPKLHGVKLDRSNLLCPNCAPRAEIDKCRSCGTDFVVNYSGIKDNEVQYCYNCIPVPLRKLRYSYKPTPFFIGEHGIYTSVKGGHLYTGFELEVELAKGKDPVLRVREAQVLKFIRDIKVQSKIGGLSVYYGKYDASIYGIEIVSYPFRPTIEVMTERCKIPLLLKKLKEFGFVATKNCGLHIHLNRSYFNLRQLRFMAILVYREIWDELLTLALRNEAQVAEYAFRVSLDPLEYGKYPRILEGAHHAALNLTEHTVEFRLFNATLDWNTFVLYMELITLIADFCKSLMGTVKIQTLKERFIQFLESYGSKEFLAVIFPLFSEGNKEPIRRYLKRNSV